MNERERTNALGSHSSKTTRTNKEYTTKAKAKNKDSDKYKYEIQNPDMVFKCSQCDISYQNIRHAYNHSSKHLDPIFNYGKYSVATCKSCKFSHQNQGIVKVHCELVHKGSTGILIVHHRFVSAEKAVKQQAPVSHQSILEKLHQFKESFGRK